MALLEQLGNRDAVDFSPHNALAQCLAAGSKAPRALAWINENGDTRDSCKSGLHHHDVLDVGGVRLSISTF